MTNFRHLIPAKHLDKVVDHGNHVVIGGEIFITDSEEVAIAIIDSATTDIMVIMQYEHDDYLIFVYCVGTDRGGAGLASHYIDGWLD